MTFVGNLGRRDFLKLAAAAAALPAGGGLLAACSRAAALPQASPNLPPPRPNASVPWSVPSAVTWPIFDDNPAIAGGLAPERGATLKVYEWREYLSPEVIGSFERRYRAYDVHVKVSSFENRDAAVARIREADSDLDVFFPTVDQLGDLIANRLLRPLNHEYLPNVPNLWPAFSGPDLPFYDVGLGYTVPYTVFSTGIAYRRDEVRARDAPGAASDPCAIFKNPRHRGRVGVLDTYREPLAMTLEAQGGYVNTSDAASLVSAADELIGFVKATELKVTTDGDYEGIARGEFAAHQAWSGDVLAARRFSGAPPALTDSRMGYWWLREGGVVGCDQLGVLSSGRNPVLAHLFLNHLLDLDVAMSNFAWNGYQPPLTEATRDAFGSRDWGRAVPSHLLDTTILTPAEFESGSMLLRLDPISTAVWVSQWERFLSVV